MILALVAILLNTTEKNCAIMITKYYRKGLKEIILNEGQHIIKRFVCSGGFLSRGAESN